MITNIGSQLRSLLGLWLLVVIPMFVSSATFDYDGYESPEVAYLDNSKTLLGYDAVPALAASEKENGATGNHVLFTKFSESVAARKTAKAKEQLISEDTRAFMVGAKSSLIFLPMRLPMRLRDTSRRLTPREVPPIELIKRLAFAHSEERRILQASSWIS